MIKRILCCNCGYITDANENTVGNVYFPTRTVYVENKLFICPDCGNQHNNIIFGEQIVNWLINPDLLEMEHVIENNEIYKSKLNKNGKETVH